MSRASSQLFSQVCPNSADFKLVLELGSGRQLCFHRNEIRANRDLQEGCGRIYESPSKRVVAVERISGEQNPDGAKLYASYTFDPTPRLMAEYCSDS